MATQIIIFNIIQNDHAIGIIQFNVTVLTTETTKAQNSIQNDTNYTSKIQLQKFIQNNSLFGIIQHNTTVVNTEDTKA